MPLFNKVFLILLFSSSISWAQDSCPENRTDYFCIPPEDNQNSLVKEVDFYEIPQRVLGLFSEELFSFPFPLQLDARWMSPYFGAGVSLYDEKLNLMILGGMARMEGLTQDAYAAIVCHELGHILGGAPYQNIPYAEWSSVEGQSDYFAASVCLPRYFSSLEVSENLIPGKVEEAGFVMFNVMKNVAPETKEQPLIRGPAKMPSAKETIMTYPSLQCRYENFRNPSVRPRCWFRP